MERKILGITQNRLGPVKTTFNGIFQPVADGIKLLRKFYYNLSTIIALLTGPRLVLLIYIAGWIVIPWVGKHQQQLSMGVVFIVLLRITAYAVIIRSWTTISSFTKLGIARSILQRVAYEVTLVRLLLFIYCINITPSLINDKTIIRIFFFSIWGILLIIDCNRAPFDLIEGERELIRGFNTEMSSLAFVFVFLGEYGMVLLLSLFIMLLNNIIIATLALISLVLFRRSSFPRLRYDSLIQFSWKVLTPLVLLVISTSCYLL